MTNQFRNKYRIPSSRLQNWDYASNAAYFITICTKEGEYFFGDCKAGKMALSEIGEVANQCWYEIPKHFPFVYLGEFVVMPNHVHGIVIINKPNLSDKSTKGNSTPVETQNLASLHATTHPQLTSSQSQPPHQKHQNKFGPQSRNLASIIRGYKIGFTKYAKTKKIVFAWQPRFHDHIIRNEQSHRTISEYIINNPLRWQGDKFYVS